MFLALIENERVRATPKAHQQFSTVCQECLQPVIARCGDQKVWHWAHQTNSDCPAGQGETDWHLHWKSLVHLHETEVKTTAWPNNRADICLDLDDSYCVVELQHSGINQDTIKEREAAYENLVWVVDARERSIETFEFFKDTRFSWSYASNVWMEAHHVILDIGEKWIYPLPVETTRGYKRLRKNMKTGRCLVFAKPTTRGEIVQIIIAIYKASISERKMLIASQPAVYQQPVYVDYYADVPAVDSVGHLNYRSIK